MQVGIDNFGDFLQKFLFGMVHPIHFSRQFNFLELSFLLGKITKNGLNFNKFQHKQKGRRSTPAAH